MKRRAAGAAPAGHGPSIALLLLGVNVFVLLLPIAALVLYRVYDIYLLRQTERQLIAQSVVVGEAYRDAYLRERGVPPGELRPPGAAHEKYVPIEPLIDLGTEIRPHEELLHLPAAPPDDSPERRAGERIDDMLMRAQIFNLSGVRVLDRRGCVVASSGGEQGRCLTPLAEVQRALGGEYASQARYRMPSNPLPPLGDIQRRGQLRVFTALPIFSDGEVIGIVTASRTGLDALSSLWHIRRALVWSVLATVVVLVAISLLFARAIARPMHSITQKAEAIARGEPGADFVPRGFTPKEVRTLSLALDVMTRKLRAQAEYVSEFATTVSHELKTPIAAIRGAAELLLDWDRMDGAQRERFLRNIDQDAERMQRLVTRLLELAKIEAAQHFVEPALVLAGHLVERALALPGEAHGVGTPVAADGMALHQSFRLQLVGDAGDVAAGDHQPLRQLAHPQPGRIALQLRHQIETGQRQREPIAQARADPALDHERAGQKTQPQPERLVMRIVNAGFRIRGRSRRQFVHPVHPVATSPPATAIACPVTACDSGRHSQATAAATSSGVTRRPWGLRPASVARAASALMPVFVTMFVIASRTRSVSVYPGHTALTVTRDVASSSANARVRPITPCLAAQ